MELPDDPIERARLLARLLDGMAVSLDVSTGDHDCDARVYGYICGAQDDGTGLVILLAEQD